jgi:hypothetical protein
MFVFGERHLRHVLLTYQQYYNETRTHLSLEKDAPIPRAVEAVGRPHTQPPPSWADYIISMCGSNLRQAQWYFSLRTTIQPRTVLL